MTPDAQPARALVRRGGPPRPSAIGWAGLVMLVLAATVQAAPPRIEVENLRIGFGSSNSFKVGTWTPVWVQLRAGDERFSGFMDVVVADDDGTPTTFRMPVDVPARSSEQFTAYVRPGSRDPELNIRLLDPNGRRVGGASQDSVMPQPPTVLMPQESLILTMGQPKGVESLPELPGFQQGGQTGPNAPRRKIGGELYLARIDPQMGRLPGRWYGFEAARAIVLDTGDPQVIAALDGLRGQALVEWVKRGGHLIVAVGANWQAVRDSVLAPILPGLPDGREKVPSLDALDVFAGSSKPITPPGTPEVLVTKLDGGRGAWRHGPQQRDVEPAAGRARALRIRPGDPHRHGRRPEALLGLGRPRALLGTGHRPAPQRTDSGNVGPQFGGGRFYQTGVSDLSTQLRVGLEQFPGVKLIPFGWVAFFIFLYILLIGPGDYFFLKKVLKRMELTWITFPTIVVDGQPLAYYAAYLLKGNDLLVNKVDVIDVDQVDGSGARHDAGPACSAPESRLQRSGPFPCRWITTPPGGIRSRGRADTDAARYRDDHDLVQRRPKTSSGPWGAPAGASASSAADIPISRSAKSRCWKMSGSRSGAPSASRPAGSAPPAPLVDSDLQPVGTDRLAGTRDQSPGHPAGGRDPGLRQAGLPPGHDRPGRDDPGRARAATATSRDTCTRSRPIIVGSNPTGTATSRSTGPT